MTAVLNAANEAANELFREDRGLGLMDIPRLIENAMDKSREAGVYKTEEVTLDDILNADQWARDKVGSITSDMVPGKKLVFV
jgi:1-deoxy-D-xylulose-5-phosphate reductoisomerase